MFLGGIEINETSIACSPINPDTIDATRHVLEEIKEGLLGEITGWYASYKHSVCLVWGCISNHALNNL